MSKWRVTGYYFPAHPQPKSLNVLTAMLRSLYPRPPASLFLERDGVHRTVEWFRKIPDFDALVDIDDAP